MINGSLGSTKGYALRRAARILPAFYVAMIGSYVIARILGIAYSSFGAWISHVFFLHTEAHRIEHVGFGANGAMWTMAVAALATIPIAGPLLVRRSPGDTPAAASAGGITPTCSVG